MNDMEITYRGSVYPAQCDHMGHMNVQWYVGKYDEATWNFLSDLGLTPSYLRENQRGMAAVEQHITYLQELKAGDIITVRSRLIKLSGKVIKFHHDMFNGETGDLASKVDMVAVHMNTDIRKSIEFAEHIVTNAEVRLKEQGTDD